MNVILLEWTGRSRPLFYAEPPDEVVEAPAGSPAVKPPAPRSRLDRLARRLWAAVLRTARRGGPWRRRLLGYLSRRTAPDEPLLRGLRRAETIVIHHPARMPARQARDHWRHYLARRSRAALIASLGDWIAATVCVPLVIVPGPNVLGLWFLYRAVTQVLAIRGIWRVQSRSVPIEFHAEEVLDEPLSAPRGPAVDRLATAFDLKNLPNFLRLTDRASRGRVAVDQAS